MKDLISIIVPVYNTDSYLDRCFSAIAGQTYENFEALIKMMVQLMVVLQFAMIGLIKIRGLG